MTRDEQLKKWVNGLPCHDHENNEHVPDFSCCHPQLEAPKKIKLYYMTALENGHSDKLKFITNLFRKEFDKEIKEFSEAIKEVMGVNDDKFKEIIEYLHKDK